jgi:hypothetical protein
MTTPVVLDEASVMPSDGSGVTVYDRGFPIPPAFFHATDESYISPAAPSEFVQWTDLDYEIGGAEGLVDRNAYVLGGIDNYSDMHDFRGDHVILTPRDAGGANGDVGGDDYAEQYAQGVAAQGYPDVTREQSWNEVSAAF